MTLGKFQLIHHMSKAVLLVSLLLAGYPTVQGALAEPNPAAATLTRLQLAQNNGTPALLLLNADQLVTPINGGTIALTVRVRDAESRAVPGVTVQLHSSLGSVTPASVITAGDGAAVVTFTAGHLPGQAQIVAETNGLVQAAAVQVVKPNDPRANTLTLTTSAGQLDPGQSLQVNATLRDSSGAPLTGELVSFFGALGEISPASAMTDGAGSVAFTYRAGNAAGQAMLTVLAGYATQSAMIQVGAPATPGQPSLGHKLFLPVVSR